MSVSYEKLKLVTVYDPQTHVNENKVYSVLRGGKEITFYQINAQSTATSSIQFSLVISNPQTIVSRQWYLTYFVDIVANGGNFQLQSLDALRQWPISSCITSLQCQINNENVSVDLSDVVQPVMRYKVNNDSIEKDFTLTAAAPDIYQNYSDQSIYGTARSPLSAFGSCTAQENRGGFPYQVLAANHIRAVVTEPLLLCSPLTMADKNATGFIGLSSATVNIANSNGLARMWYSANSGITGVTVTFYQAPILQYRAVIPLATQPVPRAVTYPYNKVSRFNTQGGALAPGASTTITTQNVQLQVMPNRIYLCARQRNADQTIFSSDSFAYITNVNVSLSGKSGLLSNASPQLLYQMCAKNGYNGGWQQWSNYNGSVLCMSPGLDISVDELNTVGSIGQYNLQIQVTYTNIGSSTINYDVYMITEDSGVFTIMNGVAHASSGVLTQQDVIQSHPVMQENIYDIHGGSFLSDLWSGIKRVATHPITRSIVSTVGPALLKKVVGGKKKHRGGALMSSTELKRMLSRN